MSLSYWAVAVQAPPGDRSGRSFDPDRMAELETDMWKAYYRKEKVRLFGLLIVLLREQFHYPWATGVAAGYHLARAAAIFGDATGRYERVLPDLERGYAIARDWAGAHYDPTRVAQDELSWWVARRDPATRSPEHVGKLIAVLYSDFYGVKPEQVERAGILRAEAADLRDREGAAADWGTIEQMLRQSYRSLASEVAARP